MISRSFALSAGSRFRMDTFHLAGLTARSTRSAQKKESLPACSSHRRSRAIGRIAHKAVTLQTETWKTSELGSRPRSWRSNSERSRRTEGCWQARELERLAKELT
jgi:hypothetical protein